jgi:hypothetical protein
MQDGRAEQARLLLLTDSAFVPLALINDCSVMQFNLGNRYRHQPWEEDTALSPRT